MEKSISRKQSERFSAEEVKELFYSIDKDRSGEISKHVTTITTSILYTKLVSPRKP